MDRCGHKEMPAIKVSVQTKWEFCHILNQIAYKSELVESHNYSMYI